MKNTNTTKTNKSSEKRAYTREISRDELYNSMKNIFNSNDCPNDWISFASKMNCSVEEILDVLNEHKIYRNKFYSAFGNPRSHLVNKLFEGKKLPRKPMKQETVKSETVKSEIAKQESPKSLSHKSTPVNQKSVKKPLKDDFYDEFKKYLSYKHKDDIEYEKAQKNLKDLMGSFNNNDRVYFILDTCVYDQTLNFISYFDALVAMDRAVIVFLDSMINEFDRLYKKTKGYDVAYVRDMRERFIENGKLDKFIMKNIDKVFCDDMIVDDKILYYCMISCGNVVLFTGDKELSFKAVNNNVVSKYFKKDETYNSRIRSLGEKKIACHRDFEKDNETYLMQSGYLANKYVMVDGSWQDDLVVLEKDMVFAEARTFLYNRGRVKVKLNVFRVMNFENKSNVLLIHSSYHYSNDIDKLENSVYKDFLKFVFTKEL